MADSSTGGPLLPSTQPPDDDEVLADFMQSVVVGITDLEPTLCFPRWQAEPPIMPRRSQTWAALGITERKADLDAMIQHNSAGQGSDTLIQNEDFTLATSFYGPRAEATAALLRDGLLVPQNREQLFLAGMAFVSCQPTAAMPAVVKELWQMRIDMDVRFRRQIRRTYPVLNLVSGIGTVVTDTHLTAPFDAH